MTDDTLREECEKWVLRNAHPRYNNTEFAWRVRALEAFARAQQAKGLMEAAREVCMYCHDDAWQTFNAEGDHISPHTGSPFICKAQKILDLLKAQATAREKHT